MRNQRGLHVENMTMNTSSNVTLNFTDSGTSDEIAAANRRFVNTMIPCILYLVLLMLVGAVGNSLVCYVFGLRLKRCAQNVFIFVLAVFDILSCLIGMPGEMVDIFLHFRYTSNSTCKLMRFVNTFTAIGSIVTLITIAVDRYRRVRKPLKAQMRTRHARYCLGIIIPTAVFFSLPATHVYGLRTVDSKINGLQGLDCTISDEVKFTLIPLIYNGVLFLCFLILTLSLVMMYSLILKSLRKHALTLRKASIGTLSTGNESLVSHCSSNDQSSSATIEHSKTPRSFSVSDNSASDVLPHNNDNLSCNPDKAYVNNAFTGEEPRDLDAGKIFSLQGEGVFILDNDRISSFDKEQLFSLDRNNLLNSEKAPSIDREQTSSLEVKVSNLEDREKNIPTEHDVDSANPISEFQKEMTILGNELNKPRNDDVGASSGIQDVKSTELRFGANSIIVKEQEQYKLTEDIVKEPQTTKCVSTNFGSSHKSSGESHKDNINVDIAVIIKSSNIDTECKEILNANISLDEAGACRDATIPHVSFDINSTSQDRTDTSNIDPLPDLLTSSITGKRRLSKTPFINNKHKDESHIRNIPLFKQNSGSKKENCRSRTPDRKNSKASQKESPMHRNITQKTTIIAFVVTLVFVLSFVPHLGLQVAHLIRKGFDEELEGAPLLLYNIFLRSYFINSVANPIIYGVMNQKFRAEIKLIITRLRCCKR